MWLVVGLVDNVDFDSTNSLTHSESCPAVAMSQICPVHPAKFSLYFSNI